MLPYEAFNIVGAAAPVYILEAGLKAPAVPLSNNTGEPMKINGPCKSEIEPDATTISPLFAVKAFIPDN